MYEVLTNKILLVASNEIMSDVKNVLSGKKKRVKYFIADIRVHKILRTNEDKKKMERYSNIVYYTDRGEVDGN